MILTKEALPPSEEGSASNRRCAHPRAPLPSPSLTKKRKKERKKRKKRNDKPLYLRVRGIGKKDSHGISSSSGLVMVEARSSMKWILLEDGNKNLTYGLTSRHRPRVGQCDLIELLGASINISIYSASRPSLCYLKKRSVRHR